MAGIGKLNIFRSICNLVRICQNFGTSGGGLKPPPRYATAVVDGSEVTSERSDTSCVSDIFCVTFVVLRDYTSLDTER